MAIHLQRCIAGASAYGEAEGMVQTQRVQEVHDEVSYLLKCAEAQNAWAVLSFNVLSSSSIERHRMKFPDSGEQICEYFARLGQPVTVLSGVLCNHPHNTHYALDDTTVRVLSQLRSRTHDTNKQFAVNFKEAPIAQFLAFAGHNMGIVLILEGADGTSPITAISMRRVSSVELVDLLDVMCRVFPCRLLPRQNGVIMVSVEAGRRWRKVVMSQDGASNNGGVSVRIKWILQPEPLGTTGDGDASGEDGKGKGVGPCIREKQ